MNSINDRCMTGDTQRPKLVQSEEREQVKAKELFVFRDDISVLSTLRENTSAFQDLVSMHM